MCAWDVGALGTDEWHVMIRGALGADAGRRAKWIPGATRTDK